MRHLKKGKSFSRDKEHRDAMFSNMMVSFFQQGRIKTTTTKAKELRRRSERIITKAKEPTLHNKRIVISKLRDRDTVAKLFNEIGPKYKNVNGGYTRIIRLGKRQGDSAELSYLELIDVKPPEETRGKKREVESPQEKKGKKKETEPPQEKKGKKKETEPPQEKKLKNEAQPPQEKKGKKTEAETSSSKKT
ncbi:MAG: 50S ribosomal protein L17 [Spirochaetota bacterium]|nr:MAG: 50S ribosomal protein L17 [Spirochaetota bacterium]